VEIQFYGANALRLTTRKAHIVIDDNLDSLGTKSITKDDDIVLITNSELVKAPNKSEITIHYPGEYEIAGASVMGIATRAHMDENGKRAVMYKILAEDIRILVVGHIYPELSEAQMEAIGTVDVLIIPVGGNGYTLDPAGALKIIKKIEPKLVIPTHYADKAIQYEVPQQDLEAAIKELAMEPKETIDKLKLKPTDVATDVTQLIILERQ